MTRETLAALVAETIKEAHRAFIVEAFGADSGLVSGEELQGLLSSGAVDPSKLGGIKIPAGTFNLDVFLFLRMAGRAMEEMSQKELAEAREWGIEEWAPIVAAQVPKEMEQQEAELGGTVEIGRPAPPPIDAPLTEPHSPRWLSEQEQAAHSESLARAGDYARGLGNAFAADMRGRTLEGWEGEQIVEEVDPEVRERMREAIREETAQAIVGSRDARKLARDLADRTGHYSHNWDRIAQTELQGAHNAGRVSDAIDAWGPDARIARITESGACPHCLRLFRDITGRPKIFTADELISNGTNVGLKPSSWRATIWPIHPHCRCDTIPVPAGYYVTEDGRIRKNKDKEASR